MEKNSVFAGAVVVLAVVIAFQVMRADAVPSPAPAPTQTVSPIDPMQSARDLPAERVDQPF